MIDVVHRNNTAIKIDRDTELDGFHSGEFWYDNKLYDIEVLEYDESVLVIADDGQTKQSEVINEYSYIEESGSRPSSEFRVDQSLGRYLVVQDRPAEITEENREEEIEAYVIQALSKKGIESDISGQEYLLGLEN